MRVEIKGKVKEINKFNKTEKGDTYQDLIIEKSVNDEFGDEIFKSHYAVTLRNLICPKVGNKVILNGFINSKLFTTKKDIQYWNTSINCGKIEIIK